MSRAVTLAGYAALASALLLHQRAAWRTRKENRADRPLTFGELVVTLTRRGIVRWALLAGWLWLGWHLFARVS